MNEYAVVQPVIFPDLRVAELPHMLPDPAVKRRRLAGQLIQLPASQPLDEFKNMLAGDVANEFVPGKVHPHHALWNGRSVDDGAQSDIFITDFSGVADEAVAENFRVRADAVLLDVRQFIAQGAFDDGREHLDLIFIFRDQGPGRVGRHLDERLADVAKRQRRAFHYLAEQENRGDEADVRLDILVEHILWIGGPVDVETAGHEEPHRQREVVHPQLLAGDEADFQLYRVAVVDSGVNLDHNKKPPHSSPSAITMRLSKKPRHTFANITNYPTKNKPGVMPSHLRTVSPQRRIISQEMVIIVMPNLKASVILYWLVLYRRAAGLLLNGST